MSGKEKQIPETLEEHRALLDRTFGHFGLNLEELKKEGKEFDFLIYKTEDANKVTGNMAGFGLEMSQRIIIDYDRNYDVFLVRRERKEGRTERRNPSAMN